MINFYVDIRDKSEFAHLVSSISWSIGALINMLETGMRGFEGFDTRTSNLISLLFVDCLSMMLRVFDWHDHIVCG